jgi:hypothetical protein
VGAARAAFSKARKKPVAPGVARNRVHIPSQGINWKVSPRDKKAFLGHQRDAFLQTYPHLMSESKGGGRRRRSWAEWTPAAHTQANGDRQIGRVRNTYVPPRYTLEPSTGAKGFTHRRVKAPGTDELRPVRGSFRSAAQIAASRKNLETARAARKMSGRRRHVAGAAEVRVSPAR